MSSRPPDLKAPRKLMVQCKSDVIGNFVLLAQFKYNMNSGYSGMTAYNVVGRSCRRTLI